MYKHQHPSKRGWNDEVDLNDQYGEKRQHPGKRHGDSDSSDDAGPCNFQESFTCNKGSLLLDLVDVSKDRVEEKRQHPGKRSAWESETEEWENNCVSFAFSEVNCQITKKFCSLPSGFLLLTSAPIFQCINVSIYVNGFVTLKGTKGPSWMGQASTEGLQLPYFRKLKVVISLWAQTPE